MHGFNGMGLGMGFGWLIGLAAIIVIVWLVVKVVNQNNQSNLSLKGSALDILNERYARDEIGKQEYEEKKKSVKQ